MLLRRRLRALLSGIGAFGMGALGIGALSTEALAVAFRPNRRIRTPRDLERLLGFAPLATLPQSAPQSERARSESILRLVGELESIALTRNSRSFAFTAASAATDLGSLLIEVKERFTQLGFDALLVPAAQVFEASRASKIGSPAAPAVPPALPQPIHPLRSRGIAVTNIERLKQGSDLLFLECLPLETSAQTEYLVRCVDTVILVVESAVTLPREVLHSSRLLHRLNRNFSTVLDQTLARRAAPLPKASPSQDKPPVVNTTAQPMTPEATPAPEDPTGAHQPPHLPPHPPPPVPRSKALPEIPASMPTPAPAHAPVAEIAFVPATTGRWDPIPPLRPISPSWPDRPKPASHQPASHQPFQSSTPPDSTETLTRHPAPTPATRPLRSPPQPVPGPQPAHGPQLAPAPTRSPAPPHPSPLAERKVDTPLPRRWTLLNHFAQTALSPDQNSPQQNPAAQTFPDQDPSPPPTPRRLDEFR